MSNDDTPEAGERATVKVAGGEKKAVWTGFIWAADDGETLIEPADVESWKERPSKGELKITGYDPAKAETPPVGDDSEEE